MPCLEPTETTDIDPVEGYAGGPLACRFLRCRTPGVSFKSGTFGNNVVHDASLRFTSQVLLHVVLGY